MVGECSQGQSGQACNWLTSEYSGVCVCVCLHSQAISEYCKAKYSAPARLHSFWGVDMLPSPCTSLNVDIKYNRHSILFSLGSNTKLPPTSAAIQATAPSKTKHDSLTELLPCF